MPVLRLSFDIYNLDDARDLHRYTGNLVEFYKKIESPEEAPKAKRAKKEPVMEQAEKQIDLPLEDAPPPPAEDSVDLATLDRERLDAELKKRAPGKGGVAWLREILNQHGVSRAAELTDDQLRQVLR
jgi:hypothetical protein